MNAENARASVDEQISELIFQLHSYSLEQIITGIIYYMCADNRGLDECIETRTSVASLNDIINIRDGKLSHNQQK